jgi:hypothetical protein
MKVWTAHLRPNAEPILVPEGFAWLALIFGPLWLAVHRAWIPAAIVLAADVMISTLVPKPLSFVLDVGFTLLVGLSAQDLRRWSIENRGYLLTHVIAARDEAEALGRLLTGRPDLARHFLPPESAR